MCAVSRRPEKPVSPSGTKLAKAGDGLNLRALGPYRILRSIGSGGMSEVYLGFDSRSRRQVAIKVLADHLVEKQSFVSRFEQEGRLGRSLTHPNIVKAHEYGRDEDSGKHFIVMEYVDGMTAQERLERDGRLPVHEATRLIIDIARALEYLHHNKFIHRDIKPGNILINADGHAKLIDLGVAKHIGDANNLTSHEHGVGTPYYMPWEQGMNSGLVDPRSDLFALGATYYHLLTGQVPFPGNDENAIAKLKHVGEFAPARRHIRELPASIDPILTRMMARHPKHRFRNALEVVEILSASGLADGTHTTEIQVPALIPQQPLAPTRADLPIQSDVDTPLESGDEQMWMVKFQSEDKTWRKMRGRTREIVQAYKEGLLPAEVFAAREPARVYRRLMAYPEFRDLFQKAETPPKKRGNRLREPRSGSSRLPWKPFLASLLFTGTLTLLLYSSAAAVLRLMTGQQ